MGIVPRQLVGKVEFFEAHLAKFAENAEAIGTTPEQVASLAAKVEAARAAYQAQQRALQAARAATQRFNDAVAEMADEGAAIIAQVRSKAKVTRDETVYAKALLPAPAQRSPTPAPGTPTRFASSVDAIGRVELTWACDTPRGSTGTLYEVHRRIGQNAPIVFLGLTGKKRYVDETIPAGATAVMYQVRAVRSRKIGGWATFNVCFGTNGIPAPPSFHVKAA